MTDPITDLFNRIRNAQAVQKATVDVPFSKFKYQIAKVLEKNGLVDKVERRGGRASRKVISISLKYALSKGGKKYIPAISNIKRVSKPGQRIYVSVRNLRRIQRGGLVIISTSKGLMTEREARKKGVGGEVIAEIW